MATGLVDSSGIWLLVERHRHHRVDAWPEVIIPTAVPAAPAVRPAVIAVVVVVVAVAMPTRIGPVDRIVVRIGIPIHPHARPRRIIRIRRDEPCHLRSTIPRIQEDQSGLGIVAFADVAEFFTCCGRLDARAVGRVAGGLQQGAAGVGSGRKGSVCN